MCFPSMLDPLDPLPAIRRLDFLDCPRNRRYSRFLDEGLDAMLAGEARGASGYVIGRFDVNTLPFGDAEGATGRDAGLEHWWMALPG
jgi:hypothetical protein